MVSIILLAQNSAENVGINLAEISYKAQVTSPLISGDASLILSERGLSVTTPFDAVELPFSEMNALNNADYNVTIKADSGDFTFSKLGMQCEPFYLVLCDAYNKAVLRSLFVKGNPLITAKGQYSYREPDAAAGAQAAFHVYENCVVALPPDLGARRIPLCFLNALDAGDFTLSLGLDTGEHYTFAKLGYDSAVFKDAIENQLLRLREKSLEEIREIDPTLTTAASQQLAKLLLRGTAAPLGQLTEIAPSFTAALESLLSSSRAAEPYQAFKQLCDLAQIHVGFKKNETNAEAPGENPLNAALGALTGEGNPLAVLDGLSGIAADDSEGESAALNPYLLWLIAPSPDGRFATVEFAEADTATFVYRTQGDFAAFARQLSRSLEAIDFKREVIRLTDAELLKPENASYLMAAKRTAALRLVRSSFVGRVIHTSTETWKKKLLELWASE